MPLTDKKYMTTEALAEMLGVCVSFLEKARWQNTGPAYHKLGNAIRYSEADVKQWLESQRRVPGRKTND